MTYSESLASRVRKGFMGRRWITEKKMFGGVNVECRKRAVNHRAASSALGRQAEAYPSLSELRLLAKSVFRSSPD